MSHLLRAELIKLRTTRTFFALAGVAIVISLLITVLVATLSEPTQDSVLKDVFQNDTSSFFVMILAVVGITGEWRHRTITSSLLAAPDRARFLLAKTLAFGAAGAALSLAIAIVTGIVGFAILGSRDLPTPGLGELAGQIGRNILVAALLGGLGVGIGSLVRNQPTAIVGILIFIFVIDPVLGQFAPDVDRFSPTGSLPDAIQDVNPADAGLSEVEFFAPAAAVALMLAWISLLYAAGAALLRRRDLE
jgi:hypothetical protein